MSEKLETQKPVYIVHSTLGIDQIEIFFSKYSEVLYIAVVYENNIESNKTVVITKNDIYLDLSNEGYTRNSTISRDTGILVRKFFVRNSDLPSFDKKETHDLYIKSPVGLTPENILKSLYAAFNDFTDCNLIQKKQYKISLDTKKPETCFVEFTCDVYKPTVALIKFLLKNRVWYTTLIPIKTWYKKYQRTVYKYNDVYKFKTENGVSIGKMVM